MGRHLERSNERLIDLDARPNGRQLDEPVQDALDAAWPLAAQVVDLAGLATGQDQAVAPRDVANVGEVPLALKQSDPEDRFAAPQLDVGYLASERRRHERVRLARPSVREGSHPHDLEAARGEVLVPKQVLGDLADGVRADRAKLLRLSYGQLVGLSQPVFLARPDDQDAWVEARPGDCLEQVHLAGDVVDEELERTTKRARDRREPGEVVDRLGSGLGQGRGDLFGLQ